MSVEVIVSKKTGKKSFRVRWYDETGKQCCKTFKRSIDAHTIDREIQLAKSNRGELPEVIKKLPNAVTFRSFSDRWLKTHAQVHKAYSSIHKDTQIIRDHFLPLFGDWNLSELSFHNMTELQAHLRTDKGLAPKTVNNIMGLLKKMLSDATYWELISKNPAERLRPLRYQQEEEDFWTFAELDRFLTFWKSRHEEYHLAVALSAHTGMRLGEIKALKRAHLDFDRREILIAQSYCSTKKDIVSTKSKKSRRVPMNEFLHSLLQRKRLLAPDQSVLNIKPRVDRFRRMSAQAGCKQIRWHDLRHTFASLCTMSGMAPLVLKELGGWSDLKMLQRYAHLAPDAKKGVTEVLCNRDMYKIPTGEELEIVNVGNS